VACTLWGLQDGGRAAVTGTHKCRGGCGASYSKIWVDNEVCFFCEARLRDEGLCGSTRCTRRCFCPHHKRCFVCDGGNGWGGCNTCRLLCGDGDDVVALVQRVGAYVVFLDFDRTLATTKRGGSPLANPSSSKTATKGSLPSHQYSHAGRGEGGGGEVTDIGEDKDFGCREAGDKERLVAAAASTHTVDEALHALACSHPNVHIVTRNSNVRDIQVFLRVQGVAATVHSVPKSSGRTKADVMLALLPEETVGVFVDDSIAEHLDPRLEQCQRLHRVLFVRG